jgi:hypothetical protein
LKCLDGLAEKYIVMAKVNIYTQLNNTRQGYVLRNILKLAGYFFVPLKQGTVLNYSITLVGFCRDNPRVNL